MADQGNNEKDVDWSKRNFLKAMIIIAAGAATVGVVQGAVRDIITPQVGITAFPSLTIVGTDGKPLKYSDIPVNSANIWVYYYPVTDDPNFLINVANSKGVPQEVPPQDVYIPATGGTYHYPGGVGPNNSIVSYSAICQHLGCKPPIIHPYPAGQSIPGVVFSLEEHPNGVIHCGCHGSTYDPWKGAAVVTGPTTHPLPPVWLKYNSDGTFTAYNMNGPTIYGRVDDFVGTPFPTGTTTTPITIIA
ncbi:MAG: Rieske 2Fe-2S domain-containing protein [Candidatus Thermoplasmatota archaeon]|nr:Rieske 2Fe-2S domain-containing protein [Candidatus Thermoplasmatota archaeon]MCL5665241.1 Rieske 2Fe-2S domain-containing protein [Candidatus Thermoplasmatota archaeon]